MDQKLNFDPKSIDRFQGKGEIQLNQIDPKKRHELSFFLNYFNKSIVLGVRKFVIFYFLFLISNWVLAKKGGDSLQIEEGIASFYAKKFEGRMTSSGEKFDNNFLTAAHKFLPFGTLIRVTRVDNGKIVLVKINDRLPQSSKFTIDLSFRAAQNLDMVSRGLCQVRLSASSPEEMNNLIAYFETRENPGLRLRPVYFLFDFERQKHFWLLAKPKLEQLIPRNLLPIQTPNRDVKKIIRGD